MKRSIVLGLVAGAAGTLALELATYLDMLVRGRPESRVPARIAGRVAEAAGLETVSGEAATPPDAAANRRTGLGALMGYASGLGIGVAYGLVRSRLGPLPAPVVGTILGATAMATSDVPAVATGATDPATWGVSGWLADVVPHLAYGLVTVGVYETLAELTRPTLLRWD